MNTKLIGLSFLFLFTLIHPFNGNAAPPLETVQTQINNALETLRNPTLENNETKEKKIRQIINNIFDYTELSKRTLGKGWKRMEPTQRNEFTFLFSELLRNVYMDRILSYTDEKVVFLKERVLSETKTEVSSEIITASKTIPINYRMIRKDNELKVYEVIIEGVSLVKNYRSQFRDILKKKSPEDLIEILKKKVNQN